MGEAAPLAARLLTTEGAGERREVGVLGRELLLPVGSGAIDSGGSGGIDQGGGKGEET